MGEHSLLNDIVFKIVFGQHEEVLRPLLNAILGLEGLDRLREVKVLNPQLDRDFLNQRGGILDIHARDDRDVRYNIEVQVRPQSDYVKRSLYYLTRLFGGQGVSGQAYEDLERCVGISLLDFVLFPKRKKMHSIYRFKELEDHSELSDVLEMHYLELSKLEPSPDGLRTSLERWVHVLRFAPTYEQGMSPLPPILRDEEGIVMALDLMKKAYSDAEVRELLRMHEKATMDAASELAHATRHGIKQGIQQGITQGIKQGIQQGIQQGLEQGRQEARQEGHKEVARRMLAQGFETDAIVKLTGLTAPEVERLRGEG